MYGSEILLQENPYRRRKRSTKRSRRNPTSLIPNPTSVASVKKFYQGVTPMDAAFAVAGLAGVTTLPGMLVKNTATTTGKALKLLAAFATAGILGLAADSVMKGGNAARATVIGGLSGAMAQTIGVLTGVSVGGRSFIGNRRSVGTARVISPGFRRESETVSLITP